MSALVRKSWFWVSLIGVLLLLLQSTHMSPVYTVDHAIYDISLRNMHKSPGSADKIAIITLKKSDLITADSALNFKEALIELLAVLAKAGSKSIAILGPVSEAQSASGLKHLAEIEGYLQNIPLSDQDKTSLAALLGEARTHMDVDRRLAKQLEQLKHVFFPFYLATDQPLPPLLDRKYSLTAGASSGNNATPMVLLPEEQKRARPIISDWPTENLIAVAAGMGYFSLLLDSDGVMRSVQLLQPYQQNWLPGLALTLAANMLDISMQEVAFRPEQSVGLGSRTIAVNGQHQIYPNFYTHRDESQSLFATYSYAGIINNEIPLDHLRQQLVLIDATDLLAAEKIVTPIGEVSGAAEVVAHTVASILNQDIYVHPQAYVWVELLLFLAVGCYLVLLLPRLGLGSGFFVTLLLLLALSATAFFLLLSQQLWLHAGLAITFLGMGYIIVATQYLFQAQRLKHVQEIYYTNRQLGLLLQEQGKLEQAFECFQKLPLNIDNLDLVYNLALDFERKRKFNNAVSALHYITAFQADFRDAKVRAERVRQMEHSMSVGTGQFNTLGSLLDETSGEKPMLGRFVIERELGKGAMGAVYLGRDPKIDRVVAVKTLALSQEFESDEIKEVEARFFHEASAAGRLNHPNIVTIYDAAEDHDLAYIAMEYIEGQPLSDFAKIGYLLPVPTVLSIIAKMADALEYAGKQGIVHRDIKPANIMYNQEGKVVKITDFGIARIASSGRTKTGMILGTPSYMSPEQMSGQHVDPRSDIFSLGVTMFVLLTGHKAFPGDSLAAISYKIVNDKHPDITVIRQDLPVSIRRVIDKALQKNPDKRYQSGIVMKRAIMRCLKELTEG